MPNDKKSLMNNTTYQGRLHKVMDRIRRRCTDNMIRLQGSPVDMLRVTATRDPKSGDIISRRVEDNEIIPVILPEMKDVPLKHFSTVLADVRGSGEAAASLATVPSFYPIGDKAYYTVQIPMACKVDDDDLLIRIIWSAEDENPYIMVLQVKEVLATINTGSIIYQKINCTFYDEELPKGIIDWILKEIKKRSEVRY